MSKKKIGTQKIESASRSMKRGTPQSGRSDTKITNRAQPNVVGRAQARPVDVVTRPSRSTK
jgi:hypothetical protein